jgi:carbohydrate-binding DOMON domain-containing protein
MSTQYRLVQSGKTASGGCSAGQGSSEPVAPRIYYLFIYLMIFAYYKSPFNRIKIQFANVITVTVADCTYLGPYKFCKYTDLFICFLFNDVQTI